MRLYTAVMDTITLIPKETALVLIDLQKGIASFPTEPLPAENVLENANVLLKAFHERDAFVVFVRVTGSGDGKDMLSPDADEPMVRPTKPTADFADLMPTLDRKDGDCIVTKRQWGAFYGTELDLQLRRRGIKTIVLGGIATNFGVESTGRDAFERGYRLIFASDAMASRTAADHTFAISRIFPRIGRVRTTADIVEAFAS